MYAYSGLTSDVRQFTHLFLCCVLVCRSSRNDYISSTRFRFGE